MIETLGARLRRLRNDRGLRLDQLGSLIGVNKVTVHYYETDSRQPSCDTLVRLAHVFNVTTDYLLGCEKSCLLDISGLSREEKNVIRVLVDDMQQKNRRLAEKPDKTGDRGAEEA